MWGCHNQNAVIVVTHRNQRKHHNGSNIKVAIITIFHIFRIEHGPILQHFIFFVGSASIAHTELIGCAAEGTYKSE
jgi:hypothetical protein